VLGSITPITSHQIVSRLCSLTSQFLGVAIFVGDIYFPLNAYGMEDIVDRINDRFITARGWVEHQVNPLVGGWSSFCFFCSNVRNVFRSFGILLFHDFNPPFLKISLS
jgi:hypothetical protein